MRIDVVTIFPGMFEGVFAFGIPQRAMAAGLLELAVHDLRDWTDDRHRSTDDASYGGGPGMVMKVEPLVTAVEALQQQGDDPASEILLLSPRGRPLKQERVRELSRSNRFILVAGRYEGVDERFLGLTGAEEISIGDYVLSGGEIPAMVLIDAVARLLPGAISDPESAIHDSFTGDLLDFPHYTRPVEFRGQSVPDVLLSGNHAAIREWRRERALEATRLRRPELVSSDRTAKTKEGMVSKS